LVGPENSSTWKSLPPPPSNVAITDGKYKTTILCQKTAAQEVEEFHKIMIMV